MNKNFLLVLISAAVLGSVGYFFLNNSNTSNDEEPPKISCLTVCTNAADACPSLINKESCATQCDSLNEEAQKHLRTAATCEELTARADLISEVLIPVLPDTEAFIETTPSTNDCEAACGNYVTSCLSLVPNAGESVLNDGYTSCIDECRAWDTQKVECMLTAINCPAMTEQCGL